MRSGLADLYPRRRHRANTPSIPLSKQAFPGNGTAADLSTNQIASPPATNCIVA